MTSPFVYDFGYPWPITWIHLNPLVLGLAAAALGVRLGWRRWVGGLNAIWSMDRRVVAGVKQRHPGGICGHGVDAVGDIPTCCGGILTPAILALRSNRGGKRGGGGALAGAQAANAIGDRDQTRFHARIGVYRSRDSRLVHIT